MLKFLMFVFSVMLFAAQAGAVQNPMKDFSDKSYGSFSGEFIAKGYKSEKIEFVTWPDELKAKLSEFERTRKLKWETYVQEGGEYEHLSAAEQEKIKNDPNSYFKVDYVTKVGQQFKIFKGEEFIGYVMDMSDSVMSTIYQDGAGIVIYLDKDMKVVSIDEWAS